MVNTLSSLGQIMVNRWSTPGQYLVSLGDWSVKVWADDLYQSPVWWRTGTERLTHGCWSSGRPSVFLTTDLSGCVKAWVSEGLQETVRKICFRISSLNTLQRPLSQSTQVQSTVSPSTPQETCWLLAVTTVGRHFSNCLLLSPLQTGLTRSD